MAYAHSELADIQYIPSSAGSLLTNASGKKYLRTVIIFNGNTATETVKLYKVPNSTGSVGTAGVSNIWYTENIEANGTRIFQIPAQGMVFDSVNDSLQGVTTTASKVTIQLYGGGE